MHIYIRNQDFVLFLFVVVVCGYLEQSVLKLVSELHNLI